MGLYDKKKKHTFSYPMINDTDSDIHPDTLAAIVDIIRKEDEKNIMNDSQEEYERKVKEKRQLKQKMDMLFRKDRAEEIQQSVEDDTITYDTCDIIIIISGIIVALIIFLCSSTL